MLWREVWQHSEENHENGAAMKYLEAISVVTYAMGLITLVLGIMLNFLLSGFSYNYGNVEILITIILSVIFIVAAIVIKKVSRTSA